MDELQRDVLSAIADDYEDIETIFSDLRSWHPGGNIKELDVGIALQQLVEQGLANAYELSADGRPATVVQFDRERLNDLYFYVSAKGKKKLVS